MKKGSYAKELPLSNKMPDNDLLSHSECYTTIGTVPFHFCVRNGYRWFQNVIFIRQSGLKI